jgi:hypothetical protein
MVPVPTPFDAMMKIDRIKFNGRSTNIAASGNRVDTGKPPRLDPTEWRPVRSRNPDCVGETLEYSVDQRAIVTLIDIIGGGVASDDIGACVGTDAAARFYSVCNPRGLGEDVVLLFATE